MTEVLTMAGMMMLTKTTVLAVLCGIVEKDKEYVQNKNLTEAKGYEIKTRKTHKQ